MATNEEATSRPTNSARAPLVKFPGGAETADFVTGSLSPGRRQYDHRQHASPAGAALSASHQMATGSLWQADAQG
jgi:hypothetical protein